MTTSMREVLEPFLTFAETFVEKAEAGWQWKNGSGSDRVCDWFGPSDFGLLQHFAALASHVEQEPVAALSSPAPDRLSEEERYVIDQSKKQMFDDLGRNSVSNANIEQLLAIIARLSRQPEAEPVAVPTHPDSPHVAPADAERLALAEIKTDQLETVDSILATLDRYTDSIQGKNDLKCGILMANYAMLEAAKIIRLLVALRAGGWREDMQS